LEDVVEDEAIGNQMVVLDEFPLSIAVIGGDDACSAKG
jgi:hypothetical protein